MAHTVDVHDANRIGDFVNHTVVAHAEAIHDIPQQQRAGRPRYCVRICHVVVAARTSFLGELAILIYVARRTPCDNLLAK
jgi:hypothetical protein